MSEEEEWAALPLPDQFAHKNWKARKNGYETAAKTFRSAQPDSDIVREFLHDSNIWKGAVADSNVAAQQEALNAYNAFLDAAGPDGARRTRGSTISGVVEKGLVGRPAAKASALESLMLLVELDKADPVVDELLPFLAHKQPKVVAATLAALREMVRAYGCKVVNPKPVLTVLPKVFGHADKNVRAEGQGLTVELYRWLREAMKPLFWNELKEVQQKDLDKLFEPIKSEPTPKQERLLRSQQAAQEEAADAAGGGGEDGGAGDDEDGGDIDLEPEYEAVDVFAKIPKDLNDRLASTKWKERKEALDEVFTAVNVPAMQEGPFDDVLRGCAKSMKDANIAVVTVAANVVECIAKGLRRSFAKYRGTVLPPMLERFKEKKTTVVEAIAAACDAVFASAGLGEIESDVLEALKNKNPQVKEHTAKFIVRSLKTTREAPTLEQTKEFAEGGKRLAGESVAALRDAGAEILGVLWKIMGDRNMLNHLEGLDEIKKTKVKEFCDAAEVRAKWKPKSVAPPAAAPKAAPGKKPAALGAKKPPAGAVKKPAAPKPASPPSDDSAPLQPRPTSRPGAPPGKGPAGLRPPGAGLRAPGSGLAKPGPSLKAPTTSGTASPKRPAAPPFSDPDTPAAAAAPRPAGRGLAGRPLGKPALSAPTSPPPPSRSDSSSALSSIERQELHDLRAEIDLLRNQTMDLRQDKLKLTSTIAELQNQNAQLIEDHTRDVLQIKAKETQLVRARSDAENAEDRANSLSKEIDRLKREMSRLGRAQGHQSNGSLDLGSAAGWNGDAGLAARPTYGASRSFHIPGSSTTRRDVVSPDSGSIGSSGGGEGKENYPDGRAPNGKLSGTPAHGDRPPLQTSYTGTSHLTRPRSNGAGSGRATPGSQDGEGGGGRSASGASGAGDGVESWRRAAEVTQNLKARIEMMKVRRACGVQHRQAEGRLTLDVQARQNIGRGQ